MAYKNREREKEYHDGYNAEYYKKHQALMRFRAQKRRKEIKLWFDNYKSGLCCEKCQESHLAIIDFHHPEEDFNKEDRWVSDLVARGASKNRIMKEVAKCRVLCSNCHRKLHWQLRQKA